MDTSISYRQRLLIVEDHALLIDGLLKLLASQPRFVVVGTVADGLAAYEVCQRLLPDIVLLDLRLPGMDGIDVIHQLQQRWPSIRVVVVTGTIEEHRARKALAAGALGYVLKQSPQQVLLTALRHAALGRSFVDSALRLDILNTDKTLGMDSTLTVRERQVLKLVAEGHRNRDVAELLSISLKTVETHRLNLRRKLDAHNAAELGHWARRLGVL